MANSSPCLCGDIFCSACFPGNDGGALEEAENWAMETLKKAQLDPDEYRIVVSVGLAAVHHARKQAGRMGDMMRANQAEIEAERQAQREYAE